MLIPDFDRVKNILITGGLGYVGGRLASALSPTHHVWVSSRNPIALGGHPSLQHLHCIRHDTLLNAFPENIDVVIHLAALNEIDSVSRPSDAIEVNINQTRQLLDASIRNSVSQFIYFSTVHVYGKMTAEMELDENAITRPVHPYAITHRAAEDYVNAAHDAGKLKGVVVRLSNSFGMPVLPTVNRWTLLVNDICRQVAERNEIRLQSNGCQYRDFITLTDVEAAVKFLIDYEPYTIPNTYNLCSGKSMKVLEMANLVSSVYKEMYHESIPVVLPDNSVATEEPFYQLKATNLEKLGFKPRNEFRNELRLLIAFCKKNFSGI